RREAIRMAAQLAKEGDIVLVAGKGHETYQEIKGIRYDFDDREELLNAFNPA
ncbi:MAG: UDP-N-acetylmuramoyl-L-alanyl-D-glutamate--2,6-diaminopimelate ligase, partial [Flavobacteriales bacterium]|nr:UDP-N-acetylmuramoyl-L-alanyl-D-glutamate--2,6-diaminopimelate ligase [Flavobacteriales bacterium]